MGVNGKLRSGVTFYDLSVVTSPRGDPCRNTLVSLRYVTSPGGGGEPFNGNDLCGDCGSAYDSDAHRSFVFYHSPADIEHAEIMGGLPSEWRPSPDEIPIPGDLGPNRVAYWRNNEAVVQVHDGDDAGFWSPCCSYTVTRSALPYSMWICRRGHVRNPCDEEYLRSIST